MDSYCYQIIRKMIMKTTISKENRDTALRLLFKVRFRDQPDPQNFGVENELNGVTIIQCLMYINLDASSVPVEVAAAFMVQIETIFSNFYASAYDFLKAETPFSFSMSPSSSADTSLPLVTTGASPPQRERRRSLSVDLVNQPSSMLLRDRNNAITVGVSSLCNAEQAHRRGPELDSRSRSCPPHHAASLPVHPAAHPAARGEAAG